MSLMKASSASASMNHGLRPKWTRLCPDSSAPERPRYIPSPPRELSSLVAPASGKKPSCALWKRSEVDSVMMGKRAFRKRDAALVKKVPFMMARTGSCVRNKSKGYRGDVNLVDGRIFSPLQRQKALVRYGVFGVAEAALVVRSVKRGVFGAEKNERAKLLVCFMLFR